jgi:hypothetical protein
MINSSKNKVYENEKRIKFVEDWRAYIVKDLNGIKKKMKDLVRKQEEEEKAFEDSIMNVSREREDKI